MLFDALEHSYISDDEVIKQYNMARQAYEKYASVPNLMRLWDWKKELESRDINLED